MVVLGIILIVSLILYLFRYTERDYLKDRIKQTLGDSEWGKFMYYISDDLVDLDKLAIRRRSEIRKVIEKYDIKMSKKRRK